MPTETASARYPLSREEHLALARHVAATRKQLQDISELLTSRYGKESILADLSGKALVCATLLEHELIYPTASGQETADHFADVESVIVKAAYQGQ